MVYFNTKEDFFHYLSYNTDEALATLKELLDNRYTWKITKVLFQKEDGITDDTHMVLDSENEFLQSELQEDENAKLFQLGFTVEEAEDYIKNLGKALVKYGVQL